MKWLLFTIYLFYLQTWLLSLVIKPINLFQQFLSFLVIKFLIIYPKRQYCFVFYFFYSDRIYYPTIYIEDIFYTYPILGPSIPKSKLFFKTRFKRYWVFSKS